MARAARTKRKEATIARQSSVYEETWNQPAHGKSNILYLCVALTVMQEANSVSRSRYYTEFSRGKNERVIHPEAQTTKVQLLLVAGRGWARAAKGGMRNPKPV